MRRPIVVRVVMKVVEQDQHGHDDQHVGQALVRGEQVAEADDQRRRR